VVEEYQPKPVSVYVPQLESGRRQDPDDDTDEDF
jgi:hypothetical protein